LPAPGGPNKTMLVIVDRNVHLISMYHLALVSVQPHLAVCIPLFH